MAKLKTYRVLLTRDITESAFIQVQAYDEEEAFNEAYDRRLDATWETNDGIGDTYMGDPENDVQEVDYGRR